MEWNEQIKLKMINFASCWGHYRALNITKQELLLKSIQEANNCHSLLIRAELVASGLEGQSKPGHKVKAYSPFTEGWHRAGWASGSSCGRQGLGTASSGEPQLPELQVNVTVLHPHGQTQLKWQSLPQEYEWFMWQTQHTPSSVGLF